MLDSQEGFSSMECDSYNHLNPDFRTNS